MNCCDFDVLAPNPWPLRVSARETGIGFERQVVFEARLPAWQGEPGSLR